MKGTFNFIGKLNTTYNITVFKCRRYNELDIDTRLLFGYKIVEMSLQASMILIIIALYYKSAARLTQRANKVKTCSRIEPFQPKEVVYC
jgi:hypothetical protein